jgi:hypothetical protein
MGSEEVRYVKLENNEGILAKRYFLSNQMNFLKLLKAIKGYHFFRLRELKARTNLLNDLREMKDNIKKLEMNIPKLTTARSFVKERETGKIGIKERKEAIRPGSDRDLEIQLREIQDKLRELSR